jgi:hypothetical protein
MKKTSSDDVKTGVKSRYLFTIIALLVVNVLPAIWRELIDLPENPSSSAIATIFYSTAWLNLSGYSDWV